MEQKKKARRIFTISASAVLALLILWTICQNLTVGVTDYTIASPDLPEAFDGYTIAQVSDLHNSKLTEQVLEILWEQNPDLIAVTGDAADANHTDLEIVQDFFMEARKIAPCAFITGNHEGWLPEEDYLFLENECYSNIHDDPDRLEIGESMVLHDKKILLERDGAEIALIGVDDPAFIVDRETMDAPERDMVTSLLSPKELRTLAGDTGFTVLLSHRPEFFENYAEAGMDLVLSGHAHGGQFRLPFVGGIYAPEQGFLPEYDAGCYTSGDTTMIVSRGIGNSVFPIRFNNQPEIVIITLQSE